MCVFGLNICHKIKFSNLANWGSILVGSKKPNVYLIMCFILLFIVEADQELEKATESRGLNEEEIKNEKPSEIIETIEKGLSTIATVMIDGVDTWVLSIYYAN